MPLTLTISIKKYVAFERMQQQAWHASDRLPVRNRMQQQAWPRVRLITQTLKKDAAAKYRPRLL